MFTGRLRLCFEQQSEEKDHNHFETSALALINIVVQWVTLYGGTEIEPRPKDLMSVYEIVYALGNPNLRKMFLAPLTDPANPLYEQLDENLRTLAQRWTSDNKEVTDCISTAQNHLSFMGDAGIRRILRNTSGARNISFADLKTKGFTVYLILKPILLRTHGRFLRLMVMSALGELYNEPTIPEHRVLFMLDEFPSLGKLELIEDAASMVREYRVRMWLIVQNIAQLQQIYGEKGTASLLSSAGLIQCFRPGPGDTITSKYISEQSGERFETYATTSNNVTSGETGKAGTGFTVGENQRQRPVVTVQEVKEIGEFGQWLIVPGVGSIIEAQRQPYWITHPEVDHLDPHHMSAEERAAWDAKVASGTSIFEPVDPHKPLQVVGL